MVTKKNAVDDEYNANKIKRLEGPDLVRHRVGMYLGSNSSEGITVALRELIDNSVDEALGGHGKEIKITMYADGSAEVSDAARGLPVDEDDEGMNGIIKTLGTVGSGGKYDAQTYEASGGMNGVGASATIATASRADVTVYRYGNKYELSFKEGHPGFFAKPGDIDAKFAPNKNIKESKDTRSAAERKARPTGTTVRFWPDHVVFLPDSEFLAEEIRFRVKATSFLVPGLKLIVRDERDSENVREDEYCFTGGLKDMLPTMSSIPFITPIVSFETNGSFEETATILGEDGKLGKGLVMRQLGIKLSFAYNEDEDTKLASFVNIIRTNNGGTHESGLWRALSREFTKHIKNTKGYLKAKEEPPTMEDVKDGFVGALSITLPEPTYKGQEKSELTTPQATAVVSQGVGEELKKWLENPKNKVAVKAMCMRIVTASRIRIEARKQKDTARKKSAMETAASMPAKLVDCAEHNELSELLLVEGDSALGTIRDARDSRYQAVFPLRGKVLNVIKSNLAGMLANKECSGIIQILGAGSGRSFNIDQARYRNVILNADADDDGSHITVLLIVFFYKYMKPLIEAGRLFVSTPPLYAIKPKTKNAEIIYAFTEQEKDEIIAGLDKKKTPHHPLSRLKGLGEMDADEFWDTTLNPETRTLKRITLEDAELAEYYVQLAMGSAVEPRRDWITEERDKLEESDIF